MAKSTICVLSLLSLATLPCFAVDRVSHSFLSMHQQSISAVRTVDNVQQHSVALSQQWHLSGDFATIEDRADGDAEHVWTATAFYRTENGVMVGLGAGETLADEHMIEPVRHYRLAVAFDLSDDTSSVKPMLSLNRIGGNIEMSAGLAVTLPF